MIARAHDEPRADRRRSRSERAAATWMARVVWGRWLGVVVALLFGLGGATLRPDVAHARGKRVVPNLEQSRPLPNAGEGPITVIGVTVHMPTEGGVPLTTRRQLMQWVERANLALRPHGLAVELRQVVSMSGLREVTRRRDRRRLATMAQHDGTIHVFVTETLDQEKLRVGRRVRGLHWRYVGLNRQLRQREYVMVTLGAPRTTFAHEVGHLLGLRHSTAEDNIMCSCRRGHDTRFTTEQGAIMLQGAERFQTRQWQAQRREQQRTRSLDHAQRRR